MGDISGIYKITNLINNKVYVGSSIKVLKRKSGHFSMLRKNNHENAYLQNAFNKYGEESFEHFVLEENVASENLIEREQFFMDLHQSADPKYGYNLCPAAGSALGYKHTAEARRKMSEVRGGCPHTFIDPEGQAITRDNLTAFEEEFGLDISVLIRVKKEKCSNHKGWRRFDETKLGVPCLSKIRTRTFINPKGQVITRDSLAAFKKEFGLATSHLCNVEEGKLYNHKGWRKFNESEVGVPCIPAHHPRTFISPEGEVITRDSLAAFGREFGLHDSGLIDIEKGKCKQYKGWTKSGETDN